MSAALRSDNGNSNLNPAMKPQVYVHREWASTSVVSQSNLGHAHPLTGESAND